MTPHSQKKVRAKRPGWFGRLLAMVPVSCVLLYPFYLAAQLDTVTDTRFFAQLPAAFDGLRIVYLSDIHFGAYFKEPRVRALVERVNALEPDLIILGGDYAEDSGTAIDFFALRPDFRAKYAVVGVVGNHDRTPPESNLSRLEAEMRAAGVTPLINQTLTLQRDGYTLTLAGIDDYYNGHPDFAAVAEDCRNADFAIFLPHTPDALPAAAAVPGDPFCQLALCGHTHGGQIAFFGHALKSSSDYGSRYLSGWYQENGVTFMVSNGVGTSFLPLRLGARPQIHLITLRAGQES